MGRWIAYPIIAGLLVSLVTLIVSWLRSPDTQVDNSFSITSFDGTYELEAQPDGSLDVLVTETIAVDFAYSGKHGIIRSIPLKYQDHANVISGVKVDGQIREYPARYGEDGTLPTVWGGVPFVQTSGTNQIDLKIGSSYTTLESGPQRYRIAYRLADVAMNTPDGTAQEVALDVNGSGWAVPTDKVQARLLVPASLKGKLNGNSACYVGPEGATARCPIVGNGSDTMVFTSTATGFKAHESMTVAVGFTPGTFGVAYTPKRMVWVAAAWVAAPLAAALVIALAVIVPPRIRRWFANRKVLVTQFTPPKDVTPLVAADVWGRPERGMAAQLIDAVVTKQVTIVTDEGVSTEAAAGASGWRQAAQRGGLRTSIRLKGLDEMDDRGIGSLLRGQFRYGLTARPNESLVARRRSLVEASGQRRLGPSEPGSWFIPTYVGFLIALGLFNLLGLSVSLEVAWWNVLAAVATIMLLVLALYRTSVAGPLTEKGKATYQHLRGLENFMAMSEADRIRFLQGTDTAPRVADGNDTMIKLYEPLLPYAVIFGLEKSWGRLIGDHDPVSPTVGLSAAAGSVLLAEVFSARGNQAYRSYRSYDYSLAMVDANHRVSSGFSNASEAFSNAFSGSNDGSGGGSSGGGWSGGSSSGGGSWSSGSSGGGGSSGSGMGGGGGSSW